MKNTTTTILASLLILVGITSSYASTITVSKDPNRTAQFDDIQTAIDDVNTAIGDTILVYGSSNSYGTVDVYKTLTLIGEGYYNDGNTSATIGTLFLQNFNASIGASNSTIIGFNISAVYFEAGFTNSVVGQRVLTGISLLRCKINTSNFTYATTAARTITDINYINCIITSAITYNQYSTEITEEITFSNCIFDGVTFTSYLVRNSTQGLDTWESLHNVKIYNSLFLNSTSGLLSNCVGIVFEDNIFFGHELFVGDYAQITWNHNLFYLIDQSPLGTNDNTGSGNLVDTNPLFTTFPSTGGGFSYAHDYHLQSSSPALTAGLEGDEIGIYGGAYPFEVGANPPVPVVTEVTIQDGTSSVPAGGTINFNFKAVSGQ